jgi:hypothetical protein
MASGTVLYVGYSPKVFSYSSSSHLHDRRLGHGMCRTSSSMIPLVIFSYTQIQPFVNLTAIDTKAGAIKNRPSLSSKSCVLLLIIIAHALKSHKSSTYSIILKLNCEDRTTSPLSYLYLYRIFKCFLMKLCAFQNGIFRKNFGVTGLISEMAGFQLRPPS